jgi:hypothetical protein
MGCVMLGRWVYIQLRHYGQNLAVWKWKSLLGIDEISAELIRAGGEILRFEIHILIPSVLTDDLLQQ